MEDVKLCRSGVKWYIDLTEQRASYRGERWAIMGEQRMDWRGALAVLLLRPHRTNATHLATCSLYVHQTLAECPSQTVSLSRSTARFIDLAERRQNPSFRQRPSNQIITQSHSTHSPTCNELFSILDPLRSRSAASALGEWDTTNWVCLNRRTVKRIPPVALVSPKLICPVQSTDPLLRSVIACVPSLDPSR